jgi:hypothetical protein
MLVFSELYPWEGKTLGFKNPVIYLLLSNFETIEQKLGMDTDDVAEPEAKETQPLKKSRKMQAAEDDVMRFEERVKRNYCSYIVQTLVFLSLVALWFIAVTNARGDQSYNSMNRSIISSTTGARSAFDETYSTYITELQQTSSFFRVKQTEDILPFVSTIEYSIYYMPYVTSARPATVAGMTSYFPYLQLRQLRSEVKSCDVAEYDVDYYCAQPLHKQILTNDLERNGYVLEFEDGDSRALPIDGLFEVYPFSGNTLEITAKNYTEYMLSVEKLVEVDWITLNTRYFVLTANYFNPNFSGYTMMMFTFMLDIEMNIVPRYIISTYYYEFYGPGEYVLSILILLTSFLMIVITVRDMTLHPDEIKYMSNHKSSSMTLTTEDIQAKLIEWENHDNRTMTKRIHCLDFLSWVVLVSAMGAIALVIMHYIWFFSILNKEFDVSDTEYVDLAYASQFYESLVIYQGMVTIFMILGVFKYGRYWIKIMAVLTKMIIVKLQYFFGFSLVSCIGLIGFAMYFFGVLGPYEYRASISYLALTGMTRLFVGRWFTTDIFAEFISVWYVIMPLFFFLYYKMTIVTLSIINLQTQFMKVMEDVAKQPQKKMAIKLLSPAT